MKWSLSSCSAMLESLAGFVKLGQPVSESNLSSDLKRILPQHTHLYIPFSLELIYCPVNGISVSFFLVTRYCSGVSCFPPFLVSVFEIFSAMIQSPFYSIIGFVY